MTPVDIPGQEQTSPQPHPEVSVPMRVFLLGLAWAILAALAPVTVLIVDWVTRWTDPPDPTMLWHLAVTCAVGGAVSFWRKHRALLQLPPILAQAKKLQEFR